MDLADPRERVEAAGRLEQRVRCTAREALALERRAPGFDVEHFRTLAREGWLDAAPLADLVSRFEVWGRTAVPGPFLACLEARGLLEAVGASAPEPDALLCVALHEPGPVREPPEVRLPARPDSAEYHLKGTKLFVPFADAAARLLVLARADDGGLSLFSLDRADAGLTLHPMPQIGPERLFEVSLDTRVSEGALLARDVDGALLEARARTLLLACGELAGLAEAALALALDHTRTREQFGRPIGSFQAVAHHCADMAMEVEVARLAVRDAAHRVDAGEAAPTLAPATHVVCAAAARRVTTTAHQVMGGVGYLEETGLSRLTRRVKALESRLGTPDWQRERVADALGLE